MNVVDGRIVDNVFREAVSVIEACRMSVQSAVEASVGLELRVTFVYSRVMDDAIIEVCVDGRLDGIADYFECWHEWNFMDASIDVFFERSH